MKVNQIDSFALYSNKINNKTPKNITTKELGFDLISNVNYVSFNARPVANKISLAQDVSKAVQSKITKLYNTLPSGTNLKKPSLVTTGNEKLGVIINKFDDGSFKVKVKDMIENAEDWATPKQNQSVITCIFDKNGVMKEGEFMNRINDNYTKRICYFTQNENCRRLKLDGMLFRPAHGENKDIWNRIKDLSTNDAVEDMNFKNSMGSYNLSEIFFELTKNKASVLK